MTDTWPCSKCGRQLSHDAFYWDAKGNRKQPCKECKAAYYRSDEYHEYRRRQQRALKYGVVHEEVLSQLQRQDSKCAICSASISEDKLCIDHDHDTGELRGLLCSPCNSAIGQLHDDPELVRSALAYLEGGGTWTTGEASSK